MTVELELEMVDVLVEAEDEVVLDSAVLNDVEVSVAVVVLVGWSVLEVDVVEATGQSSPRTTAVKLIALLPELTLDVRVWTMLPSPAINDINS
jgi:hypothetical protein